MNLDFDQMKDMTPDELMAYRDELFDTFISSVPEERQQRLRQFQWTIDGELRKYKDPIARMNKMAELFWNGFAEFQKAVEQLAEVSDKINR